MNWNLNLFTLFLGCSVCSKDSQDSAETEESSNAQDSSKEESGE